MSERLVVEVVTFKLKAGVGEADFLQAADAVMSDLQAMSGYIDRELLKDAQGQWMDILHWQSMDEALAAAEALMTAPNAGPFIAMLDATSMAMYHLEQVQVYTGN